MNDIPTAKKLLKIMKIHQILHIKPSFSFKISFVNLRSAVIYGIVPIYLRNLLRKPSFFVK